MPVSAEMAAILAEMKALNDSFIPDPCTNSRTDQTHDCRLTPQTRMERLPTLPHYVRLPTFAIDFTDGIDVKAGDSLTSTTGKGTYNVLEALLPSSYSFSTKVTALLSRRPDGSVGIRGDASVQFRQAYARPGHTQPDTIGPFEVMVDYLDPEALPAGTDFSFRIAMTWDDAIVFPDGQKPGEGAAVLWSGVSNGNARLRFPRPLVVLPAFTAYLDGTPA